MGDAVSTRTDPETTATPVASRHSLVDERRSGAVVVVQRFGGALNLNIHLHALVLDGVFTNDRGGVIARENPLPLHVD